jgi:hypothetical protein
LSFWANFNLGYIDPNRRGEADGIIMEQVRGVAWAWRSLGQAVAVLPDHHKMKHYFAQKLTNNLVFYNRSHAQDTPMRLGSPLGAMESDQNSVAAWQNDFLFVVTGYLVGLDVPGAADFFKWLGHFTIGRWTNEAAGFCPAMAAPYYIKDRDAGDRWITSWKVLFEINWPDAKTCPAGMIAGDPDSPSGYVAYAAAALAVAVQHNFPGSQAGYAELRRRAPQLRAKWSLEPEWAIVPPQESRARAE